MVIRLFAVSTLLLALSACGPAPLAETAGEGAPESPSGTEVLNPKNPPAPVERTDPESEGDGEDGLAELETRQGVRFAVPAEWLDRFAFALEAGLASESGAPLAEWEGDRARVQLGIVQSDFGSFLSGRHPLARREKQWVFRGDAIMAVWIYRARDGVHYYREQAPFILWASLEGALPGDEAGEAMPDVLASVELPEGFLMPESQSAVDRAQRRVGGDFRQPPKL